MLQHNEINKRYAELLQVKNKPIKENSIVQSQIKWKKAVNDLILSETLLDISKTKKETLGLPKDTTFFDWVIVSSYYSIFHATQSLLGLKKIKIDSRLHYATMIAFAKHAKHFIINGELADELFSIYENSEKKAAQLLEIYEEEKGKRGLFQYHRLSKNNIGPAEESIENAKTFLEAVKEVLSKNKVI